MNTTPLSQAAARPTTVCVVGAGYVGLTGAACLAALGHTVRCVESDPRRLALLQAGGVPIVEPGLLDLVTEHRANGRLTFTDDVEQAIPGADVVLLCVGTPPQPSGEPDLRQLGNATRQIAAAAIGDLVVGVKSTVPPGTCEALELLCAAQARPGVRVRVGSNPEFLREGHAVHDFLIPDRIVVGADDPAVARMLRDLYPADTTQLICDRRSAELVKYAANTFLAVKISFANEIAELCTRLGADSEAVLRGVGLDPRVGSAFLGAGPGFGGACLPKDVTGLVATGEAAGYLMRIASAASEVNRLRQEHVVTSLATLLGGLSGAHVTVLGLAFKPDTDDVRDSPASRVVRALADAGAVVTVHDPLATDTALDARQVADVYAAMDGADIVVVMTAWRQYADLDPARWARAARGHLVLDAVGIMPVADFASAGLDVLRIGEGQAESLYPVIVRPLEWALGSALA